MRRIVILALFGLLWLETGFAQSPKVYLPMEQMPDLVQCLPAPPDTASVAFAVDVQRYQWGKEMRRDSLRAAQARRDAIWILDTLAAVFSEPFGMKICPEKTPEIYTAFMRGVATIQQVRVQPKAYYHRIRPFEYFDDHLLDPGEEKELRGEGSYPSGHTIRGWAAALILSEINPAAANDLFARAWVYGENRVIVGAHWQSDVDASRPAASIGCSALHSCPEFRRQMDRARREFKRLQAKK